MSSGTFRRSAHDALYFWHDEHNRGDYLFAVYRVRSTYGAEDTAIGMAMEQSAATPRIAGFVEPKMLEQATIRVVRAVSIEWEECGEVPPAYQLQTEVYAGNGQNNGGAFEIELAVPHCLLSGKSTHLLNVIVGEIPRLGFIRAFRLMALDFSRSFGPGPAFGSDGVRQRFGFDESHTLLCRSMRPAVGLATATMKALNTEVLLGGFHGVKDDELIAFSTHDQFCHHVKTMIEARDEASNRSGERKFYLANLICEPDELESRWNVAHELGVDAVLVAPHIQGFGVLSMLARRRALPILAHNTFGELLTRHPAWGIDEAVMCRLFRHLGADWFVTPGAFALDHGDRQLGARVLVSGCGKERELAAMMPILQGGKKPDDLPVYRQSVENRAMMLIVASWLDQHPLGLRAAARIFRDAVDRLA
jgi:ribulose 1,5-bisphosphate carboxylase large subunit-like protein